MSQSLLLGARGTGSMNASATSYRGLSTGWTSAAGESTEANAQNVFRSAGTITHLYVRVTSNDRGASSATIRINGGNGNNTVSIGASTTGEFEDTTHTDNISAGDKVCVAVTTGSGGSSFVDTLYGAIYNATTNTVTHFGTAAFGALPGTGFAFYQILGQYTGNTGTEAYCQVKLHTAGTLQNAGIYISANTSTSNSSYYSRIGGANGNITMSIGSGATGFFEDTTHTDSVSADTLVNMILNIGSGGTTMTVQSQWAEYVTTDGTFYRLCQGNAVTVNANLTRNFPVSGYLQAYSTESQSQSKALVAATYSRLQCYVSANSVSATSTIYLRKGAGNVNNTLSIGSSTTGHFEDTTHTDSIVATDEINYQLITGATGTSLTLYFVGILSTVSGGTTYYVTPSGTSSNSGSFSKAISKTRTGAANNAGALTKAVDKSLVGAATNSGVLLNLIAMMRVGSSLNSGVLTKAASKTRTGSSNNAGTVTKEVDKTLTGSSTNSGALDVLRVILLVLTGISTNSGALVKAIAKTLTGQSANQGTATKAVSKAFTGSSTNSGALTVGRIYALLLQGVSTNAGVLTKAISKTFTGASSSVGTLTKLISKIFTGLATSIGTFLGIVPSGREGARIVLSESAIVTITVEELPIVRMVITEEYPD